MAASASTATTQATTATTQASNASTSAASAAASAAAALTALDNFDDTYLGAFSSNPTLDKQLKSLVLDVFDFNLTKFQNDYLKGYDLKFEIDAQFSSKPWLVKDRTKDIILF
jgi:L-ribulose-5-phosphate 3-epimerase UlaE